MKIFSILFTDGLPEMVRVMKGLKGHSFDVTYFVVADPVSVEMRNQFPGAVFHTHFEALLGKPANGVDTAQFYPPSEKLLQKLLSTESILLTMMNKLLGHLSVSERKHLYYTMVQYWLGVLTAHKPDAIIFPLVPHEVYDLVIYALAKELGIRTIMFTATQDFVRLMPFNEYTEGVVVLNKEMEIIRGQQFLLKDIDPDIQRYVKKHTEVHQDATPPNMKNLKDRYGAKKRDIILSALKDFSIFSKALRYLQKKIGHNAIVEYRSVESPPDFSSKFVYVPLQYQPEATTSPLGGVFVDQRLLVETVAAAIPDGWQVYVKEHPRQFVFNGLNFSQYRYPGYYKGLAELPNVRVIPTATDTFTLIHSAQAVALNTGTAGLEALLRKIPVLVFGYAWYRNCPGVWNVRDTRSCKDALTSIQQGYTVDYNAVINFFVAVSRVSFRGYIEPHTKRLAGVSESENCANLIRVILQELRQ